MIVPVFLLCPFVSIGGCLTSGSRAFPALFRHVSLLYIDVRCGSVPGDDSAWRTLSIHLGDRVSWVARLRVGLRENGCARAARAARSSVGRGRRRRRGPVFLRCRCSCGCRGGPWWRRRWSVGWRFPAELTKVRVRRTCHVNLVNQSLCHAVQDRPSAMAVGLLQVRRLCHSQPGLRLLAGACLTTGVEGRPASFAD